MKQELKKYADRHKTDYVRSIVQRTEHKFTEMRIRGYMQLDIPRCLYVSKKESAQLNVKSTKQFYLEYQYITRDLHNEYNKMDIALAFSNHYIEQYSTILIQIAIVKQGNDAAKY